MPYKKKKRSEMTAVELEKARIKDRRRYEAYCIKHGLSYVPVKELRKTPVSYHRQANINSEEVDIKTLTALEKALRKDK